MASETNFCVLALILPSLRSLLADLEKASHLRLVVCSNVEEFVLAPKDRRYAVVLLPADGIISHEWWSLWGAISCLDPRPSILVYSLRNDVRIWAGVLAAGGLDVIAAPFTTEKFNYALRSAANEFQRKLIL
jgi:FixJ family two-component response regulator